MSNTTFRALALVLVVASAPLVAQRGGGQNQGGGGRDFGGGGGKPSFGGGSSGGSPGPAPSFGGRSAPSGGGAPSPSFSGPSGGGRSFGGAPSAPSGRSIEPSFQPPQVSRSQVDSPRSFGADGGSAAGRGWSKASPGASNPGASVGGNPSRDTGAGWRNGADAGRSAGDVYRGSGNRPDGNAKPGASVGGSDRRVAGPYNYDHRGWNANTSPVPKLAPSGSTGGSTGLTRPSSGRLGGGGAAGGPARSMGDGAGPSVRSSGIPSGISRSPARGSGEVGGAPVSKFAGRPGVSLGRGAESGRNAAVGKLNVSGGSAAARMGDRGNVGSQRSSLAASVYFGNGGVGFGGSYSHGHHDGHHNGHHSNWGFGACFGGYPYSFGGGYSYFPYCGYPYWYGYALWAPFHYPYSSYCGYAYPSFGFGYGSSRWRFGFGFGYSYYPTYYSDCWYPYYRVYNYYPYYYYSTVSYYPVYSSVYHAEGAPVAYADSSDPYVEFEDEVPGRADAGGTRRATREVVPLSASTLPKELREPLVPGFPETLSIGDYSARGASAMTSGQYLEAAEAWRRSLLLDENSRTAALSLTTALFAAGRNDLASIAAHELLSRHADVTTAADDISAGFSSPAAFREAQLNLERYVVRNADDGSARFVLGFVYFKSGNYFAARNEFSLLQTVASDDVHVKSLLEEADRRFLAGGSETR